MAFRSLRYAGTLSGIALILAFALALRPNLMPVVTAQFQTEIASRVDFPLQPEVFDILTRSLRNNAQVVFRFMHHIAWWRDFLASTFSLGPILLLSLIWIRRLTRSYGQQFGPDRQRLIWMAALVSSLSPLLMYLLGWDCARWNVNCLLTTYLTLLLLSRGLPDGTALPFTTADRSAVILLVAINMASGSGFFDRFEMRPYPFFPNLMYTTRSSHPVPHS